MIMGQNPDPDEHPEMGRKNPVRIAIHPVVWLFTVKEQRYCLTGWYASRAKKDHHLDWSPELSSKAFHIWVSDNVSART